MTDNNTCGVCGSTLLPGGDCPRNGQYGDEAPEHVAIDEAEHGNKGLLAERYLAEAERAGVIGEDDWQGSRDLRYFVADFGDGRGLVEYTAEEIVEKLAPEAGFFNRASEPEDTPGICVECKRPAGDWGTIAGRPYCQECGEDFLAEAGYGKDADG